MRIREVIELLSIYNNNAEVVVELTDPKDVDFTLDSGDIEVVHTRCKCCEDLLVVIRGKLVTPEDE